MNNTVPLFSADVSNVRKSNKRTVKGLWRELFKFRLKCLPYPPVLMFRSRRASRSETSCDTTLSDRQLGKFCDIRHWAPFLLIGDDVTLDFMAKERENLNMKSHKWKLFISSQNERRRNSEATKQHISYTSLFCSLHHYTALYINRYP